MGEGTITISIPSGSVWQRAWITPLVLAGGLSISSFVLSVVRRVRWSTMYGITSGADTFLKYTALCAAISAVVLLVVAAVALIKVRGTPVAWAFLGGGGIAVLTVTAIVLTLPTYQVRIY